MDASITRRSLIGAACAAAAEASLTCAASPSHAAEPAAWDYETEVLVVGAGGAGLAAAVSAQDAGARVMIVEKATAECPDGYGVTRSSMANVCRVNDVEGAVAYLNATNCGYVDEDIMHAWSQMGTTVEQWLDDHGLNHAENADYGSDYKNFPGADALQAVKILDPEDPTEMFGGAYFGRTMIPLFKQNGGELLLATRARHLVLTDDGQVCGVGAERDGDEVRIRASKAVIMACGGFEGSEQLLFEYGRLFPMAGMAWPLNTGDGLLMCQEAGCDLWHMNSCCANGYGFQYPGMFELRTNIAGPMWPGKSFIFINKLGKRFTCENPHPAGGGTGHRSYLMFNGYDQSMTQVDGSFRDTPFYAVFDSKTFEAGPIFRPPFMGGLHLVDAADGGLVEDWSEDNAPELEKGYILQADTLEELAEKINEDGASDGYALDPAVLADTVATYNGYCAVGEDPEFGRPAEAGQGENLVALDTAPYYAVRLMPSIYNTVGGPRKNAKSQVVKPGGVPIPRLYAAGVFSESVAQTYTVFGQNWAEIVNFGRIAGTNAAAEEPLV